MYDVIISKVLNNPKIDKRTLLQKFISKIEMESNMNAGISSEISTIKEFINRDESAQQLGSHKTDNGRDKKSLKKSKEHQD